ncbi:hypothetical protein Bbelb_431950 [Branchiostoma belcheri]|nr:hypothetical protein Bbelb_439120 [Branchiostoma belcheri]KAI8478358.1 hypothetical protein Bbelb_439040 [Branchiostoma belcheri]KAI8479083.1 hypothetical protein Bbelb_431950 [Branchiostoma belcheri]
MKSGGRISIHPVSVVTAAHNDPHGDPPAPGALQGYRDTALIDKTQGSAGRANGKTFSRPWDTSLAQARQNHPVPPRQMFLLSAGMVTTFTVPGRPSGSVSHSSGSYVSGPPSYISEKDITERIRAVGRTATTAEPVKCFTKAAVSNE